MEPSQIFQGSPATRSKILGYSEVPLSRWVRFLAFYLCGIVPIVYVAKQYVLRPDLTQMIFFGQIFQPRALAEIRELKVAVNSPGGYDGQFYAQVALNPSLKRPELAHAMDNPGVREQRIFLPFLASLLGAERPASILFAYAILNLVFWYVLFGVLIWQMRPVTMREVIAFIAIMWTSGALFSIIRSLTDLPAATLGYMGLLFSEPAGAMFVALSIMTKPTGALYVVRYLAASKNLKAFWRKVPLIALSVSPFIAWQCYLLHVIPHATTGDPAAFSYPVIATLQSLVILWNQLLSLPYSFHFRDITQWESTFFGFLGVISVAVQSIFILARPQWRNPIWIMGAPFAILFFFLSQDMLVNGGYARTLLSVTLAFNLLVLRLKSLPIFSILFLLGNIGLFGPLHEMIGFLLRTNSLEL